MYVNFHNKELCNKSTKLVPRDQSRNKTRIRMLFASKKTANRQDNMLKQYSQEILNMLDFDYIFITVNHTLRGQEDTCPCLRRVFHFDIYFCTKLARKYQEIFPDNKVAISDSRRVFSSLYHHGIPGVLVLPNFGNKCPLVLASESYLVP